METVLVTGATGFLGKYIISQLSGSYRVLAVGRQLSKGRELEALGVRFHSCDFTIPGQLDALFDGVDYVIHAGALSSAWGQWQDFYQTNVAATGRIASLCVKHRVKRMVYLSSPSVYTEKKDRLSICEEDVNLENSLNYYIRSKLMAEDLLKREAGLNYVILRPRGLIGIGDTSLIPRLLRANEKIGVPLFNGGRNYVDITCVENAAHACICALTAENALGKAFNITNGEPREFREILEEFFASIDARPRYLKLPFPVVYSLAAGMERLFLLLQIKKEPLLTRYTVCTLGFSQTLDIRRAESLLNYQPLITLSEGIKAYGNWYKENKEHTAL